MPPSPPKKIFIDGSHGTTGLELAERIKKIPTLTLIEIPYAQRRDNPTRKKCYQEADLVVLCLPDQEAEQVVKNLEKNSQSNLKILDTSTRFRTDPDWVYGHPQLWPQRIHSAHKVANPGCYAIGFITLVYPLIKHRLISSHYSLNVFGCSGYSGGGKKMIADYEKMSLPSLLPYALDLNHKHLKEMQLITGLEKTPLFLPLVGSYYRGMVVMVSLPYSYFRAASGKGDLAWEKPLGKAIGRSLKKFYRDFYKQCSIISIKLIQETDLYREKFLSPIIHNDGLEIIISSREDGNVMLFARLDNLGKGAAGNALENIRLMLGLS